MLQNRKVRANQRREIFSQIMICELFCMRNIVIYRSSICGTKELGESLNGDGWMTPKPLKNHWVQLSFGKKVVNGDGQRPKGTKTIENPSMPMVPAEKKHPIPSLPKNDHCSPLALYLTIHYFLSKLPLETPPLHLYVFKSHRGNWFLFIDFIKYGCFPICAHYKKNNQHSLK